jgi:hypothetical protein
VSLTVCLGARALYPPEAGGHLWAYLNWALGLRALGCQVIWLEPLWEGILGPEEQAHLATLRRNLEPYGLKQSIALCSQEGQLQRNTVTDDYLDLDAAAQADLFLNLAYDLGPGVVGAFRRSALVDIDPGLTQVWADTGQLTLAPHDVNFTIGESVGRPKSGFPDLGLDWRYTPPCVSLEHWPLRESSMGTSFTTVSHWSGEWLQGSDGLHPNDKRNGFLPFLDLPRCTNQSLELALDLWPHEHNEQLILEERGWQVVSAREVASTPWDYQSYIQSSLGEFSCAKPAYVQLQTGWISDRTICYLASGKPAVVQHTGPSQILPDAAGLFRFRDVAEAARALEMVAADYKCQSRQARALAEDHFDAKKVVGRVLEQALS